MNKTFTISNISLVRNYTILKKDLVRDERGQLYKVIENNRETGLVTLETYENK